MTIFEAVKSTVTPRMAAEHYGLKVSQNGKAKCPFHNDTDPSMKFYDDHYHCFGCRETGDVIHLIAKLFRITELEAAQKLSKDFGIVKERTSVLTKLERFKTQAANEELCFNALCAYQRLLNKWKTESAPKSMDEEPDQKYAEALQMHDRIEYFLDILTLGKPEERAELVQALIADEKMQWLKDYTERKLKEADECDNRT